MANVFKSTREVVQQMCDDHKNITGITLTPDQIDHPQVIKFYSNAGAISSLYSELQRTVNDFFPFSASVEANRKHLKTRSLPDQIPAGKSHGQIQFTLTAAATIPVGTQAKRKSDGALYQSIQAGSGSGAGNLAIFFESVDAGFDKNLDSLNQPFDLVIPITGVNTACVNVSKFLDGRDLETPAEMLDRILKHDRDSDSGGNSVAYERWAREASNEVVAAKCLRQVRGADTVDLIVTAGTTDIEAAVEAGIAVNRIPSDTLITTVQNYVAIQNPVTDDVLVKKPLEQSFNSNVKYSLISESVANRAYVDGIITKVWKTFVYKARPLDVLSPTELERAIDKRVGDLIKERNAENFNGATTYFQVPADKILTPGVLTLGVL
jgi:uncharacterized phage protein gp47/JayE